MAKVIDFVGTLLPRTEKHSILDSIQRTVNEITTVTLPAYERAKELEKQGGYTSPIYKELGGAMKRHIEGSNGRPVGEVHKALTNHLENLNRLSDIITRDTGDNITIESITYRKANVLQLIGSINGFVRYATRLIGFLWLAEAGDVDARSIVQVRNPEYIWIKSKQPEFFAAVEVGLIKPEKLAKTVNELPDLIADPEQAGTVEAAIGQQKTIVSKFTVTFSPILYIRRYIDKFCESQTERLKLERDWLEDCYQRAEKEKTEGRKNPAVERRLEVYGDRLASVDRKLERYAINPE